VIGVEYENGWKTRGGLWAGALKIWKNEEKLDASQNPEEIAKKKIKSKQAEASPSNRSGTGWTSDGDLSKDSRPKEAKDYSGGAGGQQRGKKKVQK